MSLLTTQRLSPKNQATLPRDARALMGLGEGGTVCGMPNRAAKEGGGDSVPYLVLMTEAQLQRREQLIQEQTALSVERRFELIAKLNGSVRRMAIDAQHRIVLPAHFVAHIAVERDVFFVPTNTTVQVWNPQTFLRWTGQDRPDHVDPQLNAFLML